MNCRSKQGKSYGGWYLLFVPAITLTLVWVAVNSVAQTSTKRSRGATPDVGNVQNGKRIYASYGCYECHGREGQGSKLTGPRIAPDPTEFSAFVQYIRQPAGQMPPYTSKVVSDAELADIYAFLKSLPQPPAAQSIPALN